MSGRCSCRYDGEARMFSAEWHRGHRAHHLATFPAVDNGTRRNLAMFIEIAIEREATVSEAIRRALATEEFVKRVRKDDAA